MFALAPGEESKLTSRPDVGGAAKSAGGGIFTPVGVSETPPLLPPLAPPPPQKSNSRS